jgi:methylated-DNA-[protein]-cysteine S-methyltransferase
MIHYGCISHDTLGVIWLAVSDKGLCAVKIGGPESEFLQSITDGQTDPLLNADSISTEASQLRDYLDGIRREFEIEIDWSQLTTFQERALSRASTIPYGEVRTYGQVAQDIGQPVSAARAVGRAMAANPMPIVIPCHRVVGANGELTGYGGAGGIRTKAWLLELEGHDLPEQLKLPWRS